MASRSATSFVACDPRAHRAPPPYSTSAEGDHRYLRTTSTGGTWTRASKPVRKFYRHFS